VRLECAVTESFAVDHMAVVSYEDYGARNLTVMNGVEDDGIENGELRIGRNFARVRRRLVSPNGGRRSQTKQKYDRNHATQISATN
jgi:hypothetical protein